MLRVLHTSDWHLGHTLHGHARDVEHRAFLAWLEDRIHEHRVDALLVAGDVFDSANPPATALALFYGFLVGLKQRAPALDVVIVGGNHDSPARLDAPEPVLAALGIRIVGALPRRDGAPDLERLLVPLTDADGRVAARVLAIPYLRPVDLDAPREGEATADSMVRLHRELVDAALAICGPDEALLATGHLVLKGSRLSESSERRVLGGETGWAADELFPETVSYVALGHLHLAQQVGDRNRVRYCGSPIPLSMAEAGYRHQVALVELDGARLACVAELVVPRTVPLLRRPEDAARPLEELLTGLAELAPIDDTHPDRWPFLEVRVRLDRPRPSLRRDVEAALEGKAVRLVRVAVEREGSGGALGDETPVRDLSELDPEEVFHLRWRRDHAGEPPAELLAAYRELVREAEALV